MPHADHVIAERLHTARLAIAGGASAHEAAAGDVLLERFLAWEPELQTHLQERFANQVACIDSPHGVTRNEQVTPAAFDAAD